MFVLSDQDEDEAVMVMPQLHEKIYMGESVFTAQFARTPRLPYKDGMYRSLEGCNIVYVRSTSTALKLIALEFLYVKYS